MVSGGVEPVRDFLYTNPAAACAKDQCLMKYLTSGNVQIEFFDAFNNAQNPLSYVAHWQINNLRLLSLY